MFARVASVVRVPLRRAATRSFATGAAATLSSSTNFSLVAGATAVAAGLAAVATQRQEQAPVECAASFPYVGVPGTSNERTFIVSQFLTVWGVPIASLPSLKGASYCPAHLSKKGSLGTSSSHNVYCTGQSTMQHNDRCLIDGHYRNRYSAGVSVGSLRAHVDEDTASLLFWPDCPSVASPAAVIST